MLLTQRIAEIISQTATSWVLAVIDSNFCPSSFGLRKQPIAAKPRVLTLTLTLWNAAVVWVSSTSNAGTAYTLQTSRRSPRSPQFRCKFSYSAIFQPVILFSQTTSWAVLAFVFETEIEQNDLKHFVIMDPIINRRVLWWIRPISIAIQFIHHRSLCD